MRTTSLDRTKASMGYQNANQRPCCRNCRYGEQVAPSGAYNDSYPWRCKRGAFGTSALAVCDQHQSYQKDNAS